MKTAVVIIMFGAMFAAGCRSCPDPVVQTRTATLFVYPAKAAKPDRPTLEGFPFPAAFESLSEEARENVGAMLRNLSAVQGYAERLELIVERYGEEIDRIIGREATQKEEEKEK